MRKSWRLAALVLAAVTAAGVLATRAGAEGPKGEVVEYKDGDTVLEGYLATPADGKAKAGIVVAPEWWGHDAYARRRADDLAKLGYVAFALDMYGKGVHTDDPKKAGELAGTFRKDRKLMRSRAAAGLAALEGSALHPKKLGAIGYCFGGTCVLELARSGADLKAVCTFHGGLDSPDPEAGKNIKAKILCCHGGDDGFVPAKDLAAFEDEMRLGKVDWQILILGGANHSFTNPDADKHKIPGLSYNERADRRSWRAMQTFFDEAFAD